MTSFNLKGFIPFILMIIVITRQLKKKVEAAGYKVLAVGETIDI